MICHHFTCLIILIELVYLAGLTRNKLCIQNERFNGQNIIQNHTHHEQNKIDIQIFFLKY